MQGPFLCISIIVIGLLLMTLNAPRRSADQLTRLSKHSRRMSEKMHERAGDDSIFVTQRTDYLTRLLALAGMEAQYDKMKGYWIMSAAGAGVLLAIIFVLCGIPLKYVADWFLCRRASWCRPDLCFG